MTLAMKTWMQYYRIAQDGSDIPEAATHLIHNHYDLTNWMRTLVTNEERHNAHYRNLTNNFDVLTNLERHLMYEAEQASQQRSVAWRIHAQGQSKDENPELSTPSENDAYKEAVLERTAGYFMCVQSQLRQELSRRLQPIELRTADRVRNIKLLAGRLQVIHKIIAQNPTPRTTKRSMSSLVDRKKERKLHTTINS